MQEKQCTKCGQVKPLTEFRKDNRAKDKHRSECKTCKRVADEEYRKRPDIKPKRSAFLREYNRKNGHKYRGRYIFDASKYIETAKTWHKRNPEATSAHYAVHRSIAKGEIPKASNCTCTNCGEQAAHYHHHNGYEKQYWLDVIPMCNRCHRLAHSAYA